MDEKDQGWKILLESDSPDANPENESVSRQLCQLTFSFPLSYVGVTIL